MDNTGILDAIGDLDIPDDYRIVYMYTTINSFMLIFEEEFIRIY